MCTETHIPCGVNRIKTIRANTYNWIPTAICVGAEPGVFLHQRIGLVEAEEGGDQTAGVEVIPVLSEGVRILYSNYMIL